MGDVKTKRSRSPSKKRPPPSSITLRLHAPGMARLHRAGLGGLAATLRAMERWHKLGRLGDTDLPEGPDLGEGRPWKIEPTAVTLAWEEPAAARDYLAKLFAFAFAIKDDLIDQPGTYRDELSRAVRAALHNALLLTFLQHGRTRNLDKQVTQEFYEADGDSQAQIGVEYRAIHSYKHQDGYSDLIDKAGCLSRSTVEVIGPLNPGAVVRHVRFSSDTRIEEPIERVLPLYFAIIGCTSLSVNRAVGVLLVPELEDLVAFAHARPRMTPQSARECRIGGASDAALQMMLRLRLARMADQHFRSGIQEVYAMQLAPTPWAPQQKTRVYTVYVPSRGVDKERDDRSLRQFEMALGHLPPRVASKEIKETTGQGKAKVTITRREWFWVDSVVRPLVADNLGQGRRWYEGFVDLMRKLDPASKRPLRDRLVFEKRGLHAMTEEIAWENQGEATVVQAVHEALRRRYGQIASENKGNPAAMKNRWTGEYDRWRLAFAGAKTAAQLRHSLCDLFSRGGLSPVLQRGWRAVLPMLDDRRWQLTRDLALLALASYTGKGAEATEEAKLDEAVGETA